MYNLFEAALVAVSDYQFLFAATLCIHFAVLGKCDISIYHFNIGINLMIIALANALVGLMFLRDF